MITGTEILRLVRLQTNDFDEARYSDYQILNAINSALKHITQSKVFESSEFMVGTKTYTTTGALPEDYLSLIEVADSDGYTLKPINVIKTPGTREYKVMGEQIYSGAAGWTLFYKKFINSISTINSNIGLPKFCTNLITRVTVMVLENNDSISIAKAINDMAAVEIPTRKYNKKKNIIGGGES